MLARIAAALLLLAACEHKERAPETSSEVDSANKLEAEIDQLDAEITVLKRKLETATDAAQLAAYQQQVDALMVRYDDVVKRIAALRRSGSATP